MSSRISSFGKYSRLVVEEKIVKNDIVGSSQAQEE